MLLIQKSETWHALVSWIFGWSCCSEDFRFGRILDSKLWLFHFYSKSWRFMIFLISVPCFSFPVCLCLSLCSERHVWDFVPYCNCCGLNTEVSPRFLCWNLIPNVRGSGRFRERDSTSLVNGLSVYRLRPLTSSFSHVWTQEKPLCLNQGTGPNQGALNLPTPWSPTSQALYYKWVDFW